MPSQPHSVTITRGLLLANATLWLVLGAIIAAGQHPALHVQPTLRFFIAAAMPGIGAVLCALALLLGRPQAWSYYLTVGLLLLITVSFLFDQFGWTDLLALSFSLIPLVLLLKERAWYLVPKGET